MTLTQTDIHDLAVPGLMLSNTWPESRRYEGETLRCLERALKESFFAAYQCVEVPYPQERQQIAATINAENLSLTYCLTRVLNERGLDLSARDSTLRTKSVQHTISSLDDVKQAGASNLHLISGPAPPDESQRSESLKCLEQSLFEIAQAARDYQLVVLVEPLDVNAHKKKTLGHTPEAIAVIKGVRDCGCPNVGLCLDTAHMYLNNEDPKQALAQAQDWVAEFHFCNCVTDVDSTLFGDQHLPIKPPGRLGIEQMAEIFAWGRQIGFFGRDNKPRVFCEVLTQSDQGPEATLTHCLCSLRTAWSESFKRPAS